MTSRLARAAHAYAAHGWAVFPCQPRGKTPVTEHGCKDATRNHTQITAWWDRTPDANIGIATGVPSQLLVVDLDGHAGPANWALLTEQHDGDGNPLAGMTGSGGIHLVYTTTRPTRNTAGKLGVGIDTRGDGGYIIAPPSIHPCGQRYQWLNRQPALEAPGWLVDLITPPPAPRRSSTPRLPVAAGEVTAYGAAALERSLEDLARVGEGGRNDALNATAYSLARVAAAGHIPLPHVQAELHRVALQIGLTERESNATIHSGIRAGYAQPRDTPAPQPAGLAAPSFQSPRFHPPRYAW